jgi:mRNA-degrading endonuclease RelE of RelBE toxin-antitoxin system
MLRSLGALFRALTASPKNRDAIVPDSTRRAERIRESADAAIAAGMLRDDEVVAARNAEQEALTNQLVSLDLIYEVEPALEKLWNDHITPAQYREQQSAARQKAMDEGIRFSLAGSGFLLLFSDTFTKSIAKIDKNLQGRILDAITKIGKAPATAVGDTVKPLTGNLKGLWRYRIGDYRLVYEPGEDGKRITLISFEPRGDVYE